jgi:hypothetical protein
MVQLLQAFVPGLFRNDDPHISLGRGHQVVGGQETYTPEALRAPLKRFAIVGKQKHQELMILYIY